MQKGRDLILPWRNQSDTFAAHYMLSLDFSLHLSLKDFFLYIFGDLPKKKWILREGGP